jgi:Domain of unknown function (DUF4338)
LGYEQPVGEHLKYLVWAKRRPIACLAWSSAARRRNIVLVAYNNTRCLILPWIRVPHLASHFLRRVRNSLSRD